MQFFNKHYLYRYAAMAAVHCSIYANEVPIVPRAALAAFTGKLGHQCRRS